MTTVELTMYQAFAVAAIVYAVGRFLVGKIAVLSKYCIPAPVVGGLIFAIGNLILRSAGILEITFDSTLQSFFMTLFFTSVGFTASLKMLKKGGVQVFVMLAVSIVLVIMQDLVGSGLAAMFGLDPKLGLCMGSVPLVGGHGTAGAFGPLLEDTFGVVGANTVAVAAATFGLVAGGIIGGPIARKHITKRGLKSTDSGIVVEASGEGPAVHEADQTQFMNGMIFLAIAVGLGTLVTQLFTSLGITVPAYIGAMLVGAVIRNVLEGNKIHFPSVEVSILGNVSLSIFLAFALMGLKLWQLAELAIPMIVILAVQTILMALYAYFVVFNVMGRDYEAAVMSTAACGFGMGATPNAMANMQAVTSIFGPAPRAYFIVPLIGSLFIDFFNSTILTTFINVLH